MPGDVESVVEDGGFGGQNQDNSRSLVGQVDDDDAAADDAATDDDDDDDDDGGDDDNDGNFLSSPRTISHSRRLLSKATRWLECKTESIERMKVGLVIVIQIVLFLLLCTVYHYGSFYYSYYYIYCIIIIRYYQKMFV